MTKLCPRGKAAAKRKFKVYPSAYANAYASKICAGKIKDPSGVKRKDFKGPKPAAKGAMMTAGGESAMGRIQKANMVKAKKGKLTSRDYFKTFGQFPAVSAGGKRGKFSDQSKSFTKRRLALAGSLPPTGKGSRGMGKIDDANTFIKRRMLLAGPKSILPSQSDVRRRVKFLSDKYTNLGNLRKKGDPFLERRFKLAGVKKLLPKRIKAIVSLLSAAAAGAAGQKALDKRKKKKELEGDVKGSIAPYKVDKKKMGGLKAELNNPAKGYMAGGGADTGTVGEMKSKFGVALNKARRIRKRLFVEHPRKIKDKLTEKGILKSSKKQGGMMKYNKGGMADYYKDLI